MSFTIEVASVYSRVPRCRRLATVSNTEEGIMYAVIKTGGKQYRVKSGDKIFVEKLEGEIGATINLDQVLMLGGESVKLGKPLVAGAKVAAKILEHGRGEKLIIFKFRRRKNYRRKNGHRQPFTTLQITDITG